MRHLPPFSPPETPTCPPPDRVQVAVIGAGLTGLAIASGLRDSGAHVHLFEKRSHIASGMATRGLSMASRLLLDPPHRLIHALGLDTAKEVIDFSTEGVESWGDALSPTGIGYATKGEQEAAEVELNLQALQSLGIPFTPWNSQNSTGLGPGWTVPGDGCLNPSDTTKQLSKHLSISTHTHAIRIDDDATDLQIVFANGHTTKADMVILTGGAQISPWAQDKFHPVRHQAIATEPIESFIITPTHVHYGYTSIRQLESGSVMLSGCRWASPHMEVGETDETVLNTRIDEKLTEFFRQHWPQFQHAAIAHRWTGIMTFSCDGLPIIGPLPGRPRIIVCGGFGAFSPTLALRSAQAVIDGITTGDSPGVPSCFSSQRFY